MNKTINQVKLIILILVMSTAYLIPAKPNASVSVVLTAGSKTQNETYENKILWAERFSYFHFYSLALEQFEKAHKLKPGAYYPVYRIKQIESYRNQTADTYFGNLLFDFNKPGLLISALIFVIVFSLASMIVALISVLFNRNRMSKMEKKVQFLREEYQTMLINFLFSKEPVFEFVKRIRHVISTKLNRKVLIDQMIDLSITLTGEEKLRLRDLYLALNLEKDSFNKAMSRKWHIKAKGFRELAFMNIPVANKEIIRCLSSRNDILRMEAQFAMIRLNPDNSFAFLEDLEKKFTLWEQLNVYEAITFHQLNLPDFIHFLESKNSSVVLFSLRMINVFRLNKAFNAMLKLLNHPNPEIRNLTIFVMGNLKLVESLPYLKKIYKNETYENCIIIIQAMANINDESMLNFLRLVLDKEDDVQLQIEAAIAINKIGEKGSETLNKLLKSDYKNYQIIVKHVLDKRIN